MLTWKMRTRGGASSNLTEREAAHLRRGLAGSRAKELQGAINSAQKPGKELNYAAKTIGAGEIKRCGVHAYGHACMRVRASAVDIWWKGRIGGSINYHTVPAIDRNKDILLCVGIAQRFRGDLRSGWNLALLVHPTCRSIARTFSSGPVGHCRGACRRWAMWVPHRWRGSTREVRC